MRYFVSDNIEKRSYTSKLFYVGQEVFPWEIASKKMNSNQRAFWSMNLNPIYDGSLYGTTNNVLWFVINQRYCHVECEYVELGDLV
jgi:hypothetical protein